MTKGRKPDLESLPRRSNRSRKESFKIKLFNATKGKLASAKLVEEMSSPEVEMDMNGNEVEPFGSPKVEDSMTEVEVEDNVIEVRDSKVEDDIAEVKDSKVVLERIDKIPVAVPITKPEAPIKRKRGRPRKYPLVIKDNPREILNDAVPNPCSMPTPTVSDGSNDTNNYGYSDFMDNSTMRGKLLPKSPPKVKPKKSYTYEPILPPCKVCGAKASGYHFGAITCEACKVNRPSAYISLQFFMFYLIFCMCI